jgi:hypothetical protein
VRFRKHQYFSPRLPGSFGHERHIMTPREAQHSVLGREQTLDRIQFGSVVCFGRRNQDLEPRPRESLARCPGSDAALAESAMKLERNDD